VLESSAHPDVARIDPGSSGPGEALVAEALAGYRPSLAEDDAAARLDAFADSASSVLTAAARTAWRP
jgi:hypothetical protein